MDGRGGERWRRHSGSNRREYHEIRRPRHESNVREQLRWSPSRGRDSGWKNVESRHHRKPTNNGDRRFSGKHGYSYERDPSPASISSSKRPRLADEEGSSGLSVSECTLEVVSQTSGVLPGTGSKMRHERRGGGGGGMPLPVACEENTDFRERPSKNAEEPCRAFLSKLYYSYGEDKVVRGTKKLEELHSRVKEMLGKFARSVPTECSFLAPLEKSEVGSSLGKAEPEVLGSTEGKETMTTVGVADKEGSKKATGILHEREGSERTAAVLHEHLPVNTPAKERAGFKKEHFTVYGKRSSVDFNSGPSLDWHSYEVKVQPDTNFKFGKGLTRITLDGVRYYFQGFTVLSAHPLDEIPQFTFGRYGRTYTLHLVPDPSHKNYTFGDALLFEELFFGKLLEMYDWIEYIRPFTREFFFVPRFCHGDGAGGVLPLVQVLRYLLEAFHPVRKEVELEEGVLVALLNKVPSCLRVDKVRHCRGNRGEKLEEVVLEHCCSQLQRKARNYRMDSVNEKKKYKELVAKKEQRKLSQKEHFELRSLQEKLSIKDGDSSSHMKALGEDYQVSFSCKLAYSIGLYYDIPQMALTLPILTHHIFSLDSLVLLQERLGYQFKDISLLRRALVHPSCNMATFQPCEDHVRTAISNCGAPKVHFLPSLAAPRPSKGMKGLVEAVKKGLEEVDEGSRLQNNEQLEFLGDAVLEYLCSHHLYGNHPDYSAGKLTQERQLIVKNEYLRQLALRLELEDFLVKNTKTYFTEKCSSRITGNCVESILGAVFLDGGLEEADRIFAEMAFLEEGKRLEWLKYGLHPLIEACPDGDRHLVEDSPILQKIQGLEEKTGESFKHVRLLAKAFTHSSCNDTSLTGGDYQRLEFLGDAILQFLTSKFVYHRFPAHNEGHLSLLRTSLVHNKQLSVICQQLDFQDYIITSSTEKLELSVKIFADLVESYLGALTLDKGLAKAEEFLNKYLFPRLKDVAMTSNLVDSNTRLNQAAAFTCKKQGLSLQLPVYKLVSTGGTSCKPEFTVAVHFGKRKLGTGTGLTMREARGKASEAALQSGILRIPPNQ